MNSDSARSVSSEGARLAAAPPVVLLDRDRSILAFNERVLAMVTREDVPLLERLRYLCIVSSNLDELFEVHWLTAGKRVNLLTAASEEHHFGVTTPEATFWAAAASHH